MSSGNKPAKKNATVATKQKSYQTTNTGALDPKALFEKAKKALKDSKTK